MRTSRTLIFAALLLLTALPVAAQRPSAPPDQGPRAGAPAMNVERLARDLGLSSEQRAQLQELVRTQRAQGQARREQVRGRAEQRRQDMDRMRRELERERSALDAKIEAILTPEQRTKFRELRRRPQGRRGGGGVR